MSIKISPKGMPNTAGGFSCKLGMVLLVAAVCAFLLNLVRLDPIRLALSLAAMSSSFVEWLFARQRYWILRGGPSNDIGKGFLFFPILILTVTSLFCLLIAISSN
jgi:hypothetical protein